MDVTIKRNRLGGFTTETHQCDDYRIDSGILWLTQRNNSAEPIVGIPLNVINEISYQR
jgi:hypothetical protein